MAHEELSPLNITPGAIRFNTDSMKLEYFRIGSEGGSTSSYAGIGTLAAGEWVQITTDTPVIQKLKKDDPEVTIEDKQEEVADAANADDEAEREVKADMESTEVDQELSDDTPPEDTNEEDK